IQGSDKGWLENSACLGVKNIGKPCALIAHARFDEGGQARACSLLYPFLLAVGKAAESQIIAWINASRAGIDSLTALPSVSKIIYTYNSVPNNSINMSGLLATGKITVAGKEYDLDTGSWSNEKHIPNYEDHHHHVHITLDPSQLN
ncbi:MAG: hypothetical protein NTV43_15195, partial [Methylococcales bacterium]|nr:hypothetical protein [Methylococcales bacterium]